MVAAIARHMSERCSPEYRWSSLHATGHLGGAVPILHAGIGRLHRCQPGRRRRLIRALGYEPAGTYSHTVAAGVHELCSLTPNQQAQLNLDPYFSGRFDYAIDDHALTRPAR